MPVLTHYFNMLLIVRTVQLWGSECIIGAGAVPICVINVNINQRHFKSFKSPSKTYCLYFFSIYFFFCEYIICLTFFFAWFFILPLLEYRFTARIQPQLLFPPGKERIAVSVCVCVGVGVCLFCISFHFSLLTFHSERSSEWLVSRVCIIKKKKKKKKIYIYIFGCSEALVSFSEYFS